MAIKKQVPECPIVPGMLNGIDYAELIRRDSSANPQTVETPKKNGAKVKVNSNNKTKFHRS